jgi:hypothetical protein
MGLNKKSIAIICTALVSMIFLQLVPPIAQDPGYHMFADQRTILGIPHFWNVVSNLPFILIGIMGLVNVALNRTKGYLSELKPVYLVIFAGVLLTGFASAYYHLNPSNQTLVWDRLALTVVFMSVFASVWGEHVSVRMARKMVWPLIGAGIASVIYWYGTEMKGLGDLRLYALVQFLPMVLLPVILLFYRSRLTGVVYIWGLILAYTVAKATEIMDGPFYRITGGFSGHEIKHWVAAAGVFIYYLGGFRRTRLLIK